MLSLPQIGKLQEQLKSWVSRKVKSVRTDYRLWYAFEPDKGVVHVVQGARMLEEARKALAAEGRKLKAFANGKFFRRIPRKVVSWGLTLADGTYKQVRCWGDVTMSLVCSAYFSKGRIVFQLVKAAAVAKANRAKGGSNGTHTTDIEYPDLAEGNRFKSRGAVLDTLFSQTSIRDWVNASGLTKDPEFKERVVAEMIAALQPVKAKLSPAV